MQPPEESFGTVRIPKPPPFVEEVQEEEEAEEKEKEESEAE